MNLRFTFILSSPKEDFGSADVITIGKTALKTGGQPQPRYTRVKMNYKILLNGKEVGVFGHDEIENIHLSVSGGPNDMYVFASAVCKDGDKTYHYDWLQQAIGPKDKVEIVPTKSKRVKEPRKKFLMGRPTRVPSEDKSCDFCQRKETELKKLIFIDEHRPSICSDCVDLCNKLLKGDV